MRGLNEITHCSRWHSPGVKEKLNKHGLLFIYYPDASHILTLDFTCWVLKWASIHSFIHRRNCYRVLRPRCSDKSVRPHPYTASLIHSLHKCQPTLLQVLGVPQRTERYPCAQGAHSLVGKTNKNPMDKSKYNFR